MRRHRTRLLLPAMNDHEPGQQTFRAAALSKVARVHTPHSQCRRRRCRRRIRTPIKLSSQRARAMSARRRSAPRGARRRRAGLQHHAVSGDAVALDAYSADAYLSAGAQHRRAGEDDPAPARVRRRAPRGAPTMGRDGAASSSTRASRHPRNTRDADIRCEPLEKLAERLGCKWSLVQIPVAPTNRSSRFRSVDRAPSGASTLGLEPVGSKLAAKVRESACVPSAWAKSHSERDELTAAEPQKQSCGE